MKRSMSKVVRLSDYFRKAKPVCFDRHELNQLLSLYSRRVICGEWRDYAIAHGDGMAAFSVFRNAKDGPTYTVIKYAEGTHSGGDYLVCSGGRRLKRGRSIAEALKVFEPELELVSP